MPHIVSRKGSHLLEWLWYVTGCGDFLLLIIIIEHRLQVENDMFTNNNYLLTYVVNNYLEMTILFHKFSRRKLTKF